MSDVRKRNAVSIAVSVLINLAVLIGLGVSLRSSTLRTRQAQTPVFSVRLAHAPSSPVASVTPGVAPSAAKAASGHAASGMSGSSGNAVFQSGRGGRRSITAASATQSAQVTKTSTKPTREPDIDPSKVKVSVPFAPPLPTRVQSRTPLAILPTPQEKPIVRKVVPKPIHKPVLVATASRIPNENASPPTLTMPTQNGAGSTGDAGSSAPLTTGSSQGTGTVGDQAGNGAGTGAGLEMGPGLGSGQRGSASGAFGVGRFSGSAGGVRHIVYVLDVSLSMGVEVQGTKTRLDKARSELVEAVETLQPDETFNVLLFGGSVQSFKDSLMPATAQNVADAVTFLNNASLKDGTNINDAVLAALKQPGVNVIVLVTDGVPTVGEQDWNKIARSVKRANMSGVRIDAVGLVGKDPDGNDQTFEGKRLLQRIAEDNGGTDVVVSFGKAVDE